MATAHKGSISMLLALIPVKTMNNWCFVAIRCTILLTLINR